MDVLDEEMTMDNFNLHFYGEEVMQKKEEELRVGQVRPRDLGRDKLKNASILRKYGSICMGEKTNCLFWFLHKHDFIKNITCRNVYTNITSILCFVGSKCNSERISFHL